MALIDACASCYGNVKFVWILHFKIYLLCSILNIKNVDYILPTPF